jgi:hypothetical protein
MLPVSMSPRCVVTILAGLAAVLGPGTPQVLASSADAWEELQQNVEAACLRASDGVLEVTRIQVDPYGSESYGFAVLFGVETGTSTERLVACAYDKGSETAEISGAFER